MSRAQNGSTSPYLGVHLGRSGALAVFAVLVAGCGEGLEGALQAFALVALLVLLVAIGTYAVGWLGFVAVLVASWRRKSVPLAGFALGYALALCVGHVCVVMVHADPEPLAGRTELTGVEVFYLVTSVFPVTGAILAGRTLLVALAPRLEKRALLGAVAFSALWGLAASTVSFAMYATGPAQGRVEELSVAMIHGCARMADGTVLCVGANWDGQLGTGAEANRDLPARVHGIGDASRISVVDGLSCALRESGEVWCWGGEPPLHPAGAPQQLPWHVPGTADVRSMAVDEDQLFAAGGGGLVGWPRPPPPGLDDSVVVAFRNRGGCVVEESGAVRCWATIMDELIGPAAIPEVAHAVDVAANGTQGCAVTREGTVSCWSLGEEGVHVRRIDLGADEEALEVVATFGFCARTQLEHVYCWGDMNFRLPTRIETHDGAIRLGAAGNHLCASRGSEAPVCVHLSNRQGSRHADTLLLRDDR